MSASVTLVLNCKALVFLAVHPSCGQRYFTTWGKGTISLRGRYSNEYGLALVLVFKIYAAWHYGSTLPPLGVKNVKIKNQKY